jgi:hypothetical protein
VGEDVPGAQIFNSLLSGVDGVKGKIDDVKAAMNELRNAGDGGPQGVDVGLLDKGAASAAALSEQLEGVRNKGLAVAAVGAGGIALSRELQKTYQEGAAVEARLESILKAQNRLGDLGAQNDIVQNVTVKGHFADDDEIRNGAVLLDSFSVKTAHMTELLEDAARQARTMGTDVGSVAEQLGKAYNTGQVANLAKSGVTLDPADIEKVNAAYARSAAEGQALFVEIVGAAIRNNTVDLSDSLTATQAQANDAARAMDDIQTAAGEGAANAQANIDGLKNSLIGMVAVNPELAKGAGSLLTYGAYAATGIGSLIAFGAQIGQLFLGVQALNAAKALKAEAEAIDAAATSANTGATVANTGASVAATGAQAAQTVATEADAVATTELAVAEGAAAVGAGAEAVAAVTAAGATGTAGVAAAGAATGFWAMAAGVWAVIAPFAVLIGVALAAAAAIAIAAYSWNVNKDKLLNPTSSTEDTRTDAQKGQDVQTEGQLDELRVKAEQLQGKDKYATLNALAQKYIDLNQGDKASEVQAEASEARKGLTGSSKELQTPDSAEAKALLAQIQGQKADANRAAQLDGSNFHGFEKHDFWGNVVPNDASATGAPDAASLKAQADAAAAQAKAAQSAPLPAAPKALPASLSAPVSVPAAPGSGSLAGGNEDEKNPYEEQIRALQRQKRDLKGKTNAAARDELQKQIDALTDASRSWKESHASQMKATREQTSANKKATRAAEQEAKKAEREDEKLANIDAKDDVSILKAQHDEDRADQIAALQDQLDEAKEQRNVARVRALTLQIEKAKAEQKYDDAMAQAASQTDTPHRQALEQIAALRLRADERRAERAATKAVNEVNKSGESEREKTESDAAVRAQLAMRSNANSAFYTGRPIAAMMAPPVDLSAPSAPVAAQSEEGRAWNAEVRAKPRMSQNPNGTIRLILDEEIPYQGVGGMR